MRDHALHLTTAVAVYLLLVFLTPLFGSDQNQLSERHRKWLEEDVVYIITDIEKEVFLELGDDNERDLFIEAFWKQRDPTKGTPQNERKNEHYRRISHANRHFGRGSPVPGCRTDRGRIYILLGDPQQIQRFEGVTHIYPAEIWFYQDLTEFGLPAGFYLLFYKPRGLGDYRLYSPLSDGPQALLAGYIGDPTDHLMAYQRLMQVEPRMAAVSLSLIPGEDRTSTGRPSMSSDILLQNIEKIRERTARDDYARRFMDYKDRVDVEYSANYIDSSSLARVLKDGSGMYLVHYSVEPETLSLDRFDEIYFCSLRWNGVVKNGSGKIIHQIEKKASLEFDAGQIQEIRFRPLSLRDVFPLIPGEYQLSVLLLNETSKEFTSIEHPLSVPVETAAPRITPLLLCYDVRPEDEETKGIKPFLVDGRQLYIQSNQAFTGNDDLSVFFQILNPSPEMFESGEIELSILRDGIPVYAIDREIRGEKDTISFLETVSLKDFEPGYYSLAVSVGIDGQPILIQEERFSISQLESIPRPWIFSKVLPPAADSVYAFIRGSQLFNSGRLEEARLMFEDVSQRHPDSCDYDVALAKTLFALGDYKRTEEVLSPLTQDAQNASFDILFMMARVLHKLGKTGRAVSLLESMRPRFGHNIEVLNLLGICYFKEGEASKALDIWELSLQLEPAQPHLLESVRAIKEKK